MTSIFHQKYAMNTDDTVDECCKRIVEYVSSKGETLASGAPRVCPECYEAVKLDVYVSNAGAYVGTYCQCGPYSRESGYYRTVREAREALNNNNYEGR